MSICSESPCAAVSGGVSGSSGGEFMLFGVRVKIDPMRKCVSMNNLSEYEPVGSVDCDLDGKELPKVSAKGAGGGAAGYASADDAVPPPSSGTVERRRGVPWTEEEHKLFLVGLQKVGKGDWRGISRNYVKTRTSTQVASHAQKYFLRRSNLNRRRRRSSLFDITTDSVAARQEEEVKSHQDRAQQISQPSFAPFAVSPNINGLSMQPFSMTFTPIPLPMQQQTGHPVDNSGFTQGDHKNNTSSPIYVHRLPISSPTTMNRDSSQHAPPEPPPLSLGLSLSTMQLFKNGESVITVA